MSNDRHRPSEPHSPRPSDMIADRLHILAAWALRTKVTLTVDGWIVDGHAMLDLAAQQARAEDELVARWQEFRDHYVSYTTTTREREKVLRTAIAAMEQHRGDDATRKSLRLCKLRRPPLAKVRDAIAQARSAV